MALDDVSPTLLLDCKDSHEGFRRWGVPLLCTSHVGHCILGSILGHRYCSKVCKKCDIDLNKRAGELTTDEVNKIVAVVSKPLEFKIPSWMLNRNRDVKDGKTSQKYANFLDQALREDAWLHKKQGLGFKACFSYSKDPAKRL